MSDKNPNRIVRVFDNDIHRSLNWVANLSGLPYQHVFNEFIQYLKEGHILGDYWQHKLLERVKPIK